MSNKSKCNNRGKSFSRPTSFAANSIRGQTNDNSDFILDCSTTEHLVKGEFFGMSIERHRREIKISQGQMIMEIILVIDKRQCRSM